MAVAFSIDKVAREGVGNGNEGAQGALSGRFWSTEAGWAWLCRMRACGGRMKDHDFLIWGSRVPWDTDQFDVLMDEQSPPRSGFYGIWHLRYPSRAVPL